MGARPSSFKAGGGFLNGVDGVITGYEFTDQFPGSTKPAKKADEFKPLYCVLSVRVDGADEDIETTLFAGSADAFEVSEDGRTLDPAEAGDNMRQGTEFHRLLVSICEAGSRDNTFDEMTLPEDAINFEPIIGLRCRFVQVPAVGRDGQVKKRVAKKGPYKGKEFDVTTTVVDTVYAAEVKRRNGKTAAGRPTHAPVRANGKVKMAAPVSNEDEIDALATQALMEILDAAPGNSIAKNKLSLKTLTTPILKGHALREDVRARIFDDEFLTGVDGVDYDASDKKQLVSLSA